MRPPPPRRRLGRRQRSWGEWFGVVASLSPDLGIVELRGASVAEAPVGFGLKAPVTGPGCVNVAADVPMDDRLRARFKSSRVSFHECHTKVGA